MKPLHLIRTIAPATKLPVSFQCTRTISGQLDVLVLWITIVLWPESQSPFITIRLAIHLLIAILVFVVITILQVAVAVRPAFPLDTSSPVIRAKLIEIGITITVLAFLGLLSLGDDPSLLPPMLKHRRTFIL